MKWDDRNASAALATFLRHYSIDFLKFAEQKSPLPPTESGAENTAYIVASFVSEAAKDRLGLFESIKVLVRSHILSNALMCPDLEKSSKGFSGIHFMADTRFLLKALDLESQYDTEIAKTLLSTIRKLKGVVCVFPETKDEVRTTLKSIIRNMQNSSGRGTVYRELLRRGRGVATVILAEANLDTTLTSLGISTFPSPSYSEENYIFQIDEAELQDEIDLQLDYISGNAAKHDIRVVRNIFALRKGRHVSSMDDAGYMFLTTNAALSRAAFRYERNNSKGWIFPAVVTDYHLSHLAWLKSPMEAQNLTQVEILANCYATMRPDESIWNRYLAEVAQLKADNTISEREHAVLRLSINAPWELMDVTRGDVDGITPANLHIILENLEKGYASEKEAELLKVREEQAQTKKAFEEIKSAADKHATQLFLAAEREEKLKLENAKSEKEVQALKEAEQTVKKRETDRSHRIAVAANLIARSAFFVFAAICFVIGIMALWSDKSRWLGVPAAVVGLFNLLTGLSGNIFERKVKVRVASWLLKLFS